LNATTMTTASDPAPGALRSPGLPCDADGPVFAEPWQAQAFAMAIALHQRGLFSWNEWAAALAGRIAAARSAGDADLGDTYYRHWLAALEQLVSAKGASSEPELERYRQAWGRAADRTPHGRPIELKPSDFASHPPLHPPESD
jgi:nitrile hydratase accessory protein